jgi:aminoglycoside phosphotransferase (APT) family kinase protein
VGQYGAVTAPNAEVEVDEALVRRLLNEQHPDLADLPLRPLEHGWDNVSWRLGDELLVRLPHRAAIGATHRERATVASRTGAAPSAPDTGAFAMR